jgi:signal transduction histidine kinase
MAAQVAHEVKNPLSAIKSIAQVMREEKALGDYQEDLSLIVSEIDRLNRTVSQLLAFSRPGNADSQPVQLSDLINATVKLASGEATERGVELSIESECDVTLTGAQAGALREAFGNLVLNAVQATDAGGKVIIQASSQRVGADPCVRPLDSTSNVLVLSVTDTGPGIPADTQQRVFEPFYSTKARGTGLGLAIVQRRITELGGSMELISPAASDRGTTFRLLVPLALV